MKLRRIDISIIGQTRGEMGVFDANHIKRLARDIAGGKYIPPILFKEGAHYTPVSGLDTIVASSSTAHLICAVSDDFDTISAVKMLVEKIRPMQCPVEKAALYSLLNQTYKMSTVVSAALTGETKEYAYRLKGLLLLPSHTQELVKRSLISISNAQLLLRFSGDIDALADRVVTDNLKTLELRGLVLPKEKRVVDRVGDLLSKKLGFKVKIFEHKNGIHSVLLDHLNARDMEFVVSVLSSQSGSDDKIIGLV